MPLPQFAPTMSAPASCNALTPRSGEVRRASGEHRLEFFEVMILDSAPAVSIELLDFDAGRCRTKFRSEGGWRLEARIEPQLLGPLHAHL